MKERKVCAPYAFPSMSFYGRCIPSVIVHALNFTITQANEIIANRGGNTVGSAHMHMINGLSGNLFIRSMTMSFRVKI